MEEVIGCTRVCERAECNACDNDNHGLFVQFIIYNIKYKIKFEKVYGVSGLQLIYISPSSYRFFFEKFTDFRKLERKPVFGSSTFTTFACLKVAASWEGVLPEWFK